jgi:hypothetical protein
MNAGCSQSLLYDMNPSCGFVLYHPTEQEVEKWTKEEKKGRNVGRWSKS